MKLLEIVKSMRFGGTRAEVLDAVGSFSATPHERDRKTGLYVPSWKTRDAAFTYRPGNGSAGEVNRTHPASINAYFPDATNPPNLFGQPVIVDATSHQVRRYGVGEANTTGAVPWGVTVRPFPFQQPTAATSGAPATFNSGIPPSNQPVDVLRAGYILVMLGNGSITGAVLGGPVFIWCAASSGNNILGSFTTTTTAGSVAALNTNWFYMHGVQDASGIVEISFNV